MSLTAKQRRQVRSFAPYRVAPGSIVNVLGDRLDIYPDQAPAILAALNDIADEPEPVVRAKEVLIREILRAPSKHEPDLYDERVKAAAREYREAVIAYRAARRKR